MTDEKKLDVYYDHYKDTFQHQMRYIDNRNRYFLIALVLTSLLFLLIGDPKIVKEAVDSFAEKQVGKNLIFDFAYVHSFLLFGLLWVLILYFQTNLTIEKQYKYLGNLEAELSVLIEPLTISREGKFYLHTKPKFAKWVGKIYKTVFPFLIAIAVLIKLVVEIIYELKLKSPSFWINFILSVTIFIITILYFYWQLVERKRK
jgi:hypothetical protein